MANNLDMEYADEKAVVEHIDQVRTRSFLDSFDLYALRLCL